MKPKNEFDAGQFDMFRSRLDQIINLDHPLARLAKLIDWSRLEKIFSVYYAEMGRPGISIRMMIGLHLLKHIYALSDEIVCMRWIENPYYQYFCGETFFQFKEPIERSCLTHFRNRIDPKDLEHILQESLGTAFEIGALKLKDLRSVAVDTTVQEKAIAHPTDHGLLLKAAQRLGKAAVKVGIKLRQSYVRVVKSAAIKVGRYLHAKQKRRAKRALKFMQVRLGRLIRDVERKAEKIKEIPSILNQSLHKARRILHQKRGDKDYLYSLQLRLNALGKEKRRTHTSSDAKCLYPRSCEPRGNTSSYRLKHYQGSLMMDTR